MQMGRGQKVIQANPNDPTTAIETAWLVGCDTIAWDLRHDCTEALRMAKAARIRSEGWYSVARDLKASLKHPEWMHSPIRSEWAGPGTLGPQLVAPYISLNNRQAFVYAQEELLAAIERNPWCGKLWLGDIQGAPMGCGSPNLCCRSWDNSPGAKIVDETPFDLPERFFSEKFFETFVRRVWSMERPLQVVPVLCPGCERGFNLSGVPDPDGPRGTGACCDTKAAGACATDYWPATLERFRSWRGSLFVPQIGLLLMCDALDKDHPVYGPSRNWPLLAHSHYGFDLFPCVEREDAGNFQSCMVMLDAPQDVWAVPAPANYELAPATVNA
jgi:hypothetical protein